MTKFAQCNYDVDDVDMSVIQVLTSWNSLVISGLVKAAAAFDNADYYRIAERAVRFIQQHLSKERNGVRIPLHSFRGNSVADIEAFLDDYAFLIQGTFLLLGPTLC